MTEHNHAQDTLENLLCSLSQNWKLFIFRGVLALLIAVLAFAMPGESILILTLVFGAYSFADGVFGLIASMRNIREGAQWGWLMFGGIFGILTGLVVMVAPFVASMVLATFLWTSIAFWSMFAGLSKMIAANRLRKEIKGEFWLFLSGLMSFVLGIAVVWLLLNRPAESFLALGWLLGFYALFFGIMMIMLGLRLRKEKDDAPMSSAQDKGGVLAS